MHPCIRHGSAAVVLLFHNEMTHSPVNVELVIVVQLAVVRG